MSGDHVSVLSLKPDTESLCCIHEYHRYYAFAFAYNIIEDHGAEITPAYLLVNIILGQDLHYLVDICLLIAVVNLFYHLFQQTGSKNSPSKKGILWAHYFICIVLTALYLATTGLDIRGLWYQIFDPEGIKSQFFSGGRPRILYVYILDITFNAIYLSASLEILGGAFWIFTTRRQRDISNSVSSFSFLDGDYLTTHNRPHPSYSHSSLSLSLSAPHSP